MTTLKLIAGQLLNRYASVGKAPNGNGGVTGSKLAKDPFGSGFISQSGRSQYEQTEALASVI